MALILLVDDDPDILELLRIQLMGAGHHVMTADDGVQAVRIAQEALPQLILTDIHMPNSYGSTVYTILQNEDRTKNIPVIFMTGLPLEQVKPIIPDDPKVRLMKKPVDFKQLGAAIAELLSPEKKD